MTIEAKLDRIIELLEAKTETKAAPPPPPAAAKPAKVAKPAPKVEAPAEEVELEEASGPTKDEVSKVVEGLLKANKRDAAIALLKKFKAVSVSTLKESDYAAFLEEAQEIELAA